MSKSAVKLLSDIMNHRKQALYRREEPACFVLTSDDMKLLKRWWIEKMTFDWMSWDEREAQFDLMWPHFDQTDGIFGVPIEVK